MFDAFGVEVAEGDLILSCASSTWRTKIGRVVRATAAVDKGAVTYLARRLSEKTTPEGGKLWEFGVIGHGPDSDELAARAADAIRTWDRDYRGREATFEIHPLDAPVSEQRPGLFTLDTPLNRITVDWH